jgi:hypothetical protein
VHNQKIHLYFFELLCDLLSMISCIILVSTVLSAVDGQVAILFNCYEMYQLLFFIFFISKLVTILCTCHVKHWHTNE